MWDPRVPQTADPVCPWPRPWPGLCRLSTGHDHAASIALLVLPLLLHAADSWLGQPGELLHASGGAPCGVCLCLYACVSVCDVCIYMCVCACVRCMTVYLCMSSCDVSVCMVCV